MKIIDAIQEKDIRILRVLYDKWNETHVGKLSYDSQTYDYASIYQATGLTKEQFHSHLKNLQSIEFLSFDEEEVKLLPSGINYCLGQFDDMRH
jgi:DNA-binding IclR family transcriptional regulator